MMELAVSEQQGLSEDDKQRLAAQLESFDLFAQKFRASFPEKLKLPEIIADVHYPLYDKYFTELDLQHMVEFYRTPTGQKAISSMPALMQEAMRGTYRMAQPRVVALIQEIVAAERDALEPAEAP